MTRYLVTTTLVQTIDASSPEEAERIARYAVENTSGLWWPGIVGDVKVEPDPEGPSS